MLKVPSVPITLSLNDLLPDANGEIVIVSDGDTPTLSIVTELRVCDAGMASHHVTAEGVEVSGLAFYAFEGGTRLYYSPDIDLTIAAR
ncbi:MAG: hypothetical protein ACREEE_00950 [Dongiaceae bacterium]